MALPTSNPSSISSEAAPKASLHMCYMLRREDLLPNLRRLWMSPRRDNHMGALIPFLLTPSLRNITLRGYTPPPEELFPLVAKLCPSTEDLTLGVGSKLLDTAHATTRSIPLEYFGLEQLRLLSVPDDLQSRWSIRISSIRRLLSRLPRLTHVSLTVSHIEDDGATGMSQESLIAQRKSFKLVYSSLPSTRLPSLHLLPFLTHLTITVYATFTTLTSTPSFPQ
ncbi:hypothetical protein BKA70DRAFT_1435517 [Coprinopsis sp. MPI-PUGE-AT-0042]|nr:hypothetical protein BKA70DRAFT_1435517 [Coprinopsis sp. MPI-PUGE-AT-0042]